MPPWIFKDGPYLSINQLDYCPNPIRLLPGAKLSVQAVKFAPTIQDLNLQTSPRLLKTCTPVTSATVPTTGNACLKQAAATPLKEKLLMPMNHGPALPVSIWFRMKRKAASSTLRKERLWKSHGTQPGSQKDYKTRVKASGRASINLKSKSLRQTYLSPHQMNT